MPEERRARGHDLRIWRNRHEPGKVRLFAAAPSELESRSSIVCPQTTQFAILRSVLGRRESATEYIAPQWGQKKVPPSGTGPNRGTSAPPYIPRTNMRPKGNKFQRRQVHLFKIAHHGTERTIIALPRPNALADVALGAKEANTLRHRSSAAVHSITSSARASSVGGTSRPSALAVLRLMTSSNFVGCSAGISAGLPPCSILITK
jgi:hypothetical protein